MRGRISNASNAERDLAGHWLVDRALRPTYAGKRGLVAAILFDQLINAGRYQRQRAVERGVCALPVERGGEVVKGFDTEAGELTPDPVIQRRNTGGEILLFRT